MVFERKTRLHLNHETRWNPWSERETEFCERRPHAYPAKRETTLGRSRTIDRERGSRNWFRPRLVGSELYPTILDEQRADTGVTEPYADIKHTVFMPRPSVSSKVANHSGALLSTDTWRRLFNVNGDTLVPRHSFRFSKESACEEARSYACPSISRWVGERFVRRYSLQIVVWSIRGLDWTSRYCATYPRTTVNLPTPFSFFLKILNANNCEEYPIEYFLRLTAFETDISDDQPLS